MFIEMKRFLLAFLVALCGCTKAEAPKPSVQPASTQSVVTSVTPSSVAPPPAEPVLIDPQSAGPAYVLVDHSGILEITSSGATKIFPVSQLRSSHFTEITLSPAGSLWMSDFQGIRVRPLKGDFEVIRQVKDGPLYEKLVVRSETDAWAVSSDIEWQVLHYQGKDWKSTGKRGQFSGRFDDNKFSGLAVTSEGVWISSWNGVWRGVGDQWESVALPEGIGTGPDLLVYRDQLIVASPSAVYMRKSGIWSKLAWPENIMLRRIVSDLGLFAAPSRDKPRIVLGSVNGDKPFVESDPMLGQDIRTLAFDGAGRLWAGSDKALAVFDQRGHLLKQWPMGTLDGLTGDVLDIAVVASGPDTLPKLEEGRRWDVTGKFVTYKQSKPLAGAALVMCSSASSDCTIDPDVKRTTTDVQGSFRFSGVVDGQFRIQVQPVPDTDDCKTPFNLKNVWLHPARDCHDAPGSPGKCDMGTITTCLPFEMPPPPPPRR